MSNNEIKTRLDERQELKRMIDEANARIKAIDAELLPMFEVGAPAAMVGPWKVSAGTKTTSTLDKKAVSAAGIDLAPYYVSKTGAPFLTVRG